MEHFNFNNLFILDLANNHQGDAAHGRRIIDALGSVVETAGVHAAIKFQFRQLDTLIHPAHQADSNAAHVPRFLSTRLSSDEYTDLVSVVRENNMVTMCTPFDEDSIGLIAEIDFDAIKVASCSVTDMPLLEEIAKAGKPVVISTGGCLINEIDRVVHLMTRNNVPFSLEHCVSIYPTPPRKT